MKEVFNDPKKRIRGTKGPGGGGGWRIIKTRQ